MVLQGAAWSSLKRQLRFYKIFKDKHSSIKFLLGEMPFDKKYWRKYSNLLVLRITSKSSMQLSGHLTLNPDLFL